MTHYNVVNIRLDDRSWQDKANCLGVDPDLFFPERGASTREAKEVCRGCVVRMECLEYALVNGEKFGIWGGMSERERRRLRRQRAQAARRPSSPPEADPSHPPEAAAHAGGGPARGPSARPPTERWARRASMVRSGREVELVPALGRDRRAARPAAPAPPAPRRRRAPGRPPGRRPRRGRASRARSGSC